MMNNGLNLWDVLILLAVAAAVILALFRIRRRKKAGKGGCGCGCEGCSAPCPAGRKGSSVESSPFLSSHPFLFLNPMPQ